MLWTDIELPPRIPLDVQLRFQRESVARRPHDAARHVKLGNILMALENYPDAVAAFVQAERLLPVTSANSTNSPDATSGSIGLTPHSRFAGAGMRLCRITRNSVLCAESCCVRSGEKRKHARHSWKRFPSVPMLSKLWNVFYRRWPRIPMMAIGYWRFAGSFPRLCQLYRRGGYRGIALSRVGRLDEARSLVDLERYPARVTFEPPAEFGGIERFNSLLANEIFVIQVYGILPATVSIGPSTRYSRCGNISGALEVFAQCH